MRNVLLTGLKVIGYFTLPFIFFMGIHLLIATCSGIFNFIAGNGFASSFLISYLDTGNQGISAGLTIFLTAGLLVNYLFMDKS